MEWLRRLQCTGAALTYLNEGEAAILPLGPRVQLQPVPDAGDVFTLWDATLAMCPPGHSITSPPQQDKEEDNKMKKNSWVEIKAV